MEAFFSWLGFGFGALFVVAVVVAWWEHLARQLRPPARPAAAAPRAVKVDVPLDTVAGVLLPPSDKAERRATLGGAMERMGRVGLAARADAPPSADAWTKTSPMPLQPLPDPEDTPAAKTPR